MAQNTFTPGTPLSLNDEIRHKYAGYADLYDRMVDHWLMENLHLRRCRRRLLRQARGNVLEVAVGTGLNLRYYPPGCAITAIDLTPAMLNVARRRATTLNREVSFAVMDAEHLAFADHSFDTVASSLSTCTFPDPVQALREMARVCVPGGRILLLEHGRTSWAWAARRQDRLAERHYARLSCRWNQDPLALVQQAGLRVLHVRHSALDVFSEIEAQP
jgi:ubiquinone/menaquinone biosynthesis C-methylase UbiE